MKRIAALLLVVALPAFAQQKDEEELKAPPPVILRVISGEVLARNIQTGEVLGRVEVSEGVFMNQTFAEGLQKEMAAVEAERDARLQLMPVLAIAAASLALGFGGGFLLLHH